MHTKYPVVLQQHRGILSILYLCGGSAMASQQTTFVETVLVF